jgi:nitroreductase
MAGSEDFVEQVRRLRVVRSFLPEPVSAEDLAAVLEAGRWTGSSKNDQAWAVVVVDDPERKKELAAAGRYADPLVAAPVAVAIVRLPGGNDFDQGRLAQNLMLAAAGRGLGSCPVTLHNDGAAAKALGLPSGHRARWAIAIGHPAGTTRPFAGGGRKPRSEFAYSDRFGRPWRPN